MEPVPGKAKRAAKNVLTRMNTVKGPLAMLQTCMDKNIRIKVLTRNMSGIRGHCSGYLVAFDKHFNIALQDVTEVWTRRKHIKSPALGKYILLSTLCTVYMYVHNDNIIVPCRRHSPPQIAAATDEGRGEYGEHFHQQFLGH
ncbi:U7 snRNA binding [Homalodisca vitripennis]|nr:U7 snRNA binding [Homalodisca vitripennis]